MKIATTAITQDKNLYAIEALPLITIYDDNFFVRNDYDVLSIGQRQYLIRFLKNMALNKKVVKPITNGQQTIVITKPNSNLAVSSFEDEFLQLTEDKLFCVTPTMFAEALFYWTLDSEYIEVIKVLRRLIKKCPYNIEWLRDINYRSPIEQISKDSYLDLSNYQKFIVEQRFKSKKAL